MNDIGAHVAHAELVAYWAHELGDEAVARVDEHMFTCAACSTAAERVAAIVVAIRGLVPPAIAREQVDALRARGLTIRDTEFDAGARKGVTFERDVELMIHHLAGLPLADAERVELVVRSETLGVLHRDPFAPFDRERGEVLIACQRHFAAFPSDIAFDVHVHRAGGAAPTVATYFIPHVFL